MSNNLGISGNDYNDREIMEKTRMEGAANGAVKFHYVLPSGQELTSEWVSEDNKKHAAMPWCEAVRSAIVADVTEIQRKKIGEKPRKKSPIIVPEGTNTEAPPPPDAARVFVGTTEVQTVTQSADDMDPEVYLAGRLERAKRRVELADGAADAALEEQQNARTELSKIRKLIAAMAQE